MDGGGVVDVPNEGVRRGLWNLKQVAVGVRWLDGCPEYGCPEVGCPEKERVMDVLKWERGRVLSLGGEWWAGSWVRWMTVLMRWWSWR